MCKGAGECAKGQVSVQGQGVEGGACRARRERAQLALSVHGCYGACTPGGERAKLAVSVQGSRGEGERRDCRERAQLALSVQGR